MNIAVVSAIFGVYDEPCFTAQTVPCRHVMVTDDRLSAPAGWEHHQHKIGGLHPRLAGKFPKCRPWEYADAEIYVWIDGSILPQPGLVAQMVADLGDGEAAFHPHPDRQAITAEALVSSQMHKYPEWMDVRRQAQSYVDAGHPDSWGLYAAGLYIWRNTTQIRQAGQMWLDEILRWSHQDQISLPVVLRRAGVDVRPLTGGLRGNPLFKIRRHADRS